MADDKKSPKEASNIFHNVMKASVTPKKASEMKNYELVLRFIEMHPDLNSPIHMAIGDRVTKEEVEDTVSDLISKGYVIIINSKPSITDKGLKYLETK